jgi:hypothetical protein
MKGLSWAIGTPTLGALLVGGCSGSSSSAVGLPSSPQFVDVAPSVGLDFSGSVGPLFPELTVLDHQLMQRNMGNGAAVGDYDDDGDLDVYLLAQVGLENRLYRNTLDLGTKGFEDVTSLTPAVADLGFSRVAFFADLDDDGDLDLLLINDDNGTPEVSPSKILRNDGAGTFTDATPGSGFRPVGYLRAGAALADSDLDGLLDVYVTNWGFGTSGGTDFPGSNRLYRNIGAFRFEDITASVHPDAPTTNSFSAIFKDFDGDLVPDLFVAVDGESDEFFWNRAGLLQEATEDVGANHIGNDMGIACADFDDDGDLDMYTTNIHDPSGVLGRFPFTNAFYVNQLDATGAVEFRDEAVDRGVEDTYWGWGVEFVDVENDRDLDIVAVTGFDDWIESSHLPNPLFQTPSVLFVNDGTGQFTRFLGTDLDNPDDSRALIAFDYDRDGDQDLLIANLEQPVRLLENVSENPGHWLDVALRPDSKAIGAIVFATIGGQTLRRDVIAGRSYLAGTPSEVHFGLGDAVEVGLLRVVWADGVEQTFRDVPADQLIELRAP